MKRLNGLLCLLLAIGMILSLASCQSDSGNETTAPGTQEQETTADEPSDDQVETEIIGGSEGVTLRLTFSGQEFSQEPLEEVLTDFYENTGISTEVMFVPSDGGWAGYFSKIQTMIAANDSPDVIRIAIEGFLIFQSQGLIEPLDPYFEKFPEYREILDDLHPNLSAPFTVDGKLYGLTFDWNNVVMHINTNILEEAGLTMPAEDWSKEDFLEYAQAMTYGEGDDKVFGFAIPNYYFAVSAWLFNNGASILNDDMTEGRLNTPEAIEIIEFFRQLIHEYEVAPQPPFDTTIAFMNDQVAMHCAGRWPLRSYTESGFDAMDIQYLPTMKTNEVIFGSGIFPVLTSSEYKDEAFKLACALSESTSQKKILEISHIPSSISVMEEVLPTASFPGNSRIYADSADVSRAVESPAQYAEVQSIFDRHLSSVLANEVEAATAMEQATLEINTILQN